MDIVFSIQFLLLLFSERMFLNDIENILFKKTLTFDTRILRFASQEIIFECVHCEHRIGEHDCVCKGAM